MTRRRFGRGGLTLLIAILSMANTEALPAQTRSARTASPSVQQAIMLPRRPMRTTLQLMWRTDRSSGAARLLYPFDVHSGPEGILIFDYSERTVIALSASTGREVFRVGRRGSGPGEFAGQATWFGSDAAPHLVEHGTNRVTALLGRTLTSVAIAPGRWTSGCRWGVDQMLLRRGSPAMHDLFVTTVGASARIVDSVAAPWPHIQREHMLVRQSFLKQVDDSTCALLPAYFKEFAILVPGKPARLGEHREPLPPARAIVNTQGKNWSASFAPGARGGAMDMRAWRDYLVVLYEGSTRNRRRLLDFYRRGSLDYAGTVLLPLETSRFAVRGDTLVALCEDDGVPIVATFLLTSNDEKRR